MSERADALKARTKRFVLDILALVEVASYRGTCCRCRTSIDQCGHFCRGELPGGVSGEGEWGQWAGRHFHRLAQDLSWIHDGHTM